MSLSAEDFEALFDSAHQSAVHLELRDSYATSEEDGDYARWLRTGVANLDPESDFWLEWTKLVRRTVGRGVVVRRVRIVSEPVTDYVRYEYAGTPVNLSLGEGVRWLPRRNTSELALPGNDFWLIDGKTVLWNHFSGDGEVVGHEITANPVAAQLCAQAFVAAWERGIEHDQYNI